MLNKELLIAQTPQKVILIVDVVNDKPYAFDVSLSINNTVIGTEIVSDNDSITFRVSENVHVGDVVAVHPLPNNSLSVQLSKEERNRWKITGTNPVLTVWY